MRRQECLKICCRYHLKSLPGAWNKSQEQVEAAVEEAVQACKNELLEKAFLETLVPQSLVLQDAE